MNNYGYNNGVLDPRDLENRLKEVQQTIQVISMDFRYNRIPPEAINQARMTLFNLEKEEKELIARLTEYHNNYNYRNFNSYNTRPNEQNTAYNVGGSYGTNRYSFGQNQDVNKTTSTSNRYQAGNEGYQSKTKILSTPAKPFEVANKNISQFGNNDKPLPKEEIEKLVKENAELRSQVEKINKELIEIKENLKMLIKIEKVRSSDKPFITDSDAKSVPSVNLNNGSETHELYKKEGVERVASRINLLETGDIELCSLDEVVDKVEKELFRNERSSSKNELYKIGTNVGNEIIIRSDESHCKVGETIAKLYEQRDASEENLSIDEFATNIVKREFQEVLEFLSKQKDMVEVVRLIEQFESETCEDMDVQLGVIPENILESLKFIPSDVWSNVLNIIGLEINKIGKYDLGLGVDLITGVFTHDDMKVVDNALRGNDDRMMRNVKDIEKYIQLSTKFIQEIDKLFEVKSLEYEFTDMSVTLKVYRKYEAYMLKLAKDDFKEMRANGYGLGVVVPESHELLYTTVEKMVNESNLGNGSISGLILVISTTTLYETMAYEVLSIEGTKENRIFTLKRLK